jgi:hypothetical protein
MIEDWSYLIYNNNITYAIDTYAIDTYAIDTYAIDTYAIDTYAIDTYAIMQLCNYAIMQ